MLSLTRVNSNQASTYYTKDDYYLQEVGHWHGELASALNYSGSIKEADFQSLIQGVDNRKVPRFEIQNGGKEHTHTAGVDLTFSAPKSVSIAGLVLDDEKIIEAHTQAVNATLDYIEKQYTNVRIKEDGQVHTEYTGNMLVAKFQHMSSRELDPQLHTHCLVMNFTTKENGDIRAMDFGEMYNAKMLLGQMYRSELAANLKDIGYQIESDSKGLFEIKGFSPELLKEFSTRSEQIQARFNELRQEYPNMNEAELKAMATLDTRKVKDEPNKDELKTAWIERLQEMNIDKEKLAKELASNSNNYPPKQEIDKVIEKAVNIATEHEAVAKEKDILQVATKISMGDYRISELQDALEKNQNIIHLKDNQYTTFAIAEMEHKIVEEVLAGKNTMVGMDKVEINKSILDYQQDKGFNLTEGQKAAVQHVLASEDRIIAIQGDAGTGKTTMLDVVRTIAEKENMQVTGLSFTGKAASEIEEASQISSRTIASLVNGMDDLKGKLVVIDEASMLSIKDMSAVLGKCDDNTKIVLIGDTKQLQSIGQGKIFSSLQEKEAIDVVRMPEVQRQKDVDYKDVVDKLGERQVAAAFEQLEKRDAIKTIENRDERLSAITQAYLEKPKESIIVTATNKDREDLNSLIRSELVRKDHVKEDRVNMVTRETKGLIGTEKFFAENYAVRDVIVANSAGIIGKTGAEGRVLSVDRENNTITVKTQEKSFTVNLNEQGNKLQVYTEKSREFAEGDKILFLKNDRGLDVKNGQTGYITAIKEDHTVNVKMDNGKTLQFNPEKQYKYLGHGYALTDYKSQGQTEKHVIYHADTNKGVNFNQAYVGITRGKESVTIYTNDKITLKELVKQEQQKTSTLDHNYFESKAMNHARLEILASKIPDLRALDTNYEKGKNLTQVISEEVKSQSISSRSIGTIVQQRERQDQGRKQPELQKFKNRDRGLER